MSTRYPPGHLDPSLATLFVLRRALALVRQLQGMEKHLGTLVKKQKRRRDTWERRDMQTVINRWCLFRDRLEERLDKQVAEFLPLTAQLFPLYKQITLCPRWVPDFRSLDWYYRTPLKEIRRDIKQQGHDWRARSRLAICALQCHLRPSSYLSRLPLEALRIVLHYVVGTIRRC
jgi:hypothetical protein